MIMLYKNMKAIVCLLPSDTDFFNILTGVLQRDILAPFLFIICLDLHTMNVDRSNKKKWSQTKKKRQKTDGNPLKLSRM